MDGGARAGSDVEAEAVEEAEEAEGSSLLGADCRIFFTLRLASFLWAIAARTSLYCTWILQMWKCKILMEKFK